MPKTSEIRAFLVVEPCPRLLDFARDCVLCAC
jgi:hypothetical protein